MRWAMLLFAFLCIALGVWPELLYRLLPYPTDYQAYSGAHVLTQLQLLLFSGLAFFVMLPYLKRTLTITLDTDWVWRKWLPSLGSFATRQITCLQALSRAQAQSLGNAFMAWVNRSLGQDARLSGTWATRDMALWVLLLLLGYLLLYYL
jgi:multicomponent Na+:H+ antiporter subunit D